MPQPRKPLSISKAFNQASRHPAWNFQRGNNLRGIAGAWKIPEGMTASGYEDITLKRLFADEELQQLAGVKTTRALEAYWRGGGIWQKLKDADAPQVLKDSWDALVSLNPKLAAVTVDREKLRSLLDAHYGVTSGFNIDDINFFQAQKKIGDGLPAKQAHAMPDHGPRLTRIDAVSKPPMYWVASPETAKKVEQRYKRKGLLN
ncbi:MAG: hypothetical protein IT560_08060 [Alphaproteobacteria bacterium]|nr:hypothetical protein [Alphaproteobacteria bacterium]